MEDMPVIDEGAAVLPNCSLPTLLSAVESQGARRNTRFWKCCRDFGATYGNF
jgi:hypothetical protein